MIRNIAPLQFGDTEPGLVETKLPEFRWVDPATLMVDESYQRSLGKRSIKMIKSIMGAWDWRRFKPPVVVETDAGLKVIDGQHTAISAASHPQVDKIPVMVVEADDVAQQASAFIGHNLVRLQMTKVQLHHAGLTAGEPQAAEIEKVCRLAGAKILRTQPTTWAPGETLAIKAIGDVIKRHGAARARKIMEILVAAKCAPVRTEYIKAVTALMTEPEYEGSFDPAELSKVIGGLGEKAFLDAKVFAVEHKLRSWRALAITWFMRVSNGSGQAPKKAVVQTGPVTPKRTSSDSMTGYGFQTKGPTASCRRDAATPSVSLGDPAPGRSALDARRRGEG